MGHKSAMVWRRTFQLKSIISGAIKCMRTQSEFAQSNRHRKDILTYPRNIKEYFPERG